MCIVYMKSKWWRCCCCRCHHFYHTTIEPLPKFSHVTLSADPCDFPPLNILVCQTNSLQSAHTSATNLDIIPDSTNPTRFIYFHDKQHTLTHILHSMESIPLYSINHQKRNAHTHVREENKLKNRLLANILMAFIIYT